MTALSKKSVRLLTLVLLALATTAALLLWRPRVPVRQDPSARVAPSSVSRTNLVLISGHLCLAGQDRPFNGLMLEHWADGSLRSRSAVTNGLLHGLSEGWHTNGQLQVTEYFNKGVSHGLRTKWHAKGRKLSECEIADGKIDGTFQRWLENGSIAEQVDFVHGQPQGLALAYFESGFLKSRARLKDGKVIEQKFWEDGQTKDRR